MFAATAIINGTGIVTWLSPRQLIDLGFPDDPVLWYAATGIGSLVAGVTALRLVQAASTAPARPADLRGHLPRRSARPGHASLRADALIGCAGVMLVSGVAFNVTRAVSVIWVNRSTTTEVRATVHSFLSQAESAGEIVGGLALAGLARAVGPPVMLIVSAVLIAGLAVLGRPVAHRPPGRKAAQEGPAWAPRRDRRPSTPGG